MLINSTCEIQFSNLKWQSLEVFIFHFFHVVDNCVAPGFPYARGFLQRGGSAAACSWQELGSKRRPPESKPAESGLFLHVSDLILGTNITYTKVKIHSFHHFRSELHQIEESSVVEPGARRVDGKQNCNSSLVWSSPHCTNTKTKIILPLFYPQWPHSSLNNLYETPLNVLAHAIVVCHVNMNHGDDEAPFFFMV